MALIYFPLLKFISYPVNGEESSLKPSSSSSLSQWMDTSGTMRYYSSQEEEPPGNTMMAVFLQTRIVAAPSQVMPTQSQIPGGKNKIQIKEDII